MITRTLVALLSLVLSNICLAEAASKTTLPAMNFVSSVAGDEVFGVIKTDAAFANLDKELWGSPLTLLVTHTLRPTATGKATGLLSAIWSGSTLGLLPVVTNNDLIISYQVRVHGKDVAVYTFQRTFTRAVNIWAKDETHGLGQDGLDWVKGTASEFAAAASADARLADLQREYATYFGQVP